MGPVLLSRVVGGGIGFLGLCGAPPLDDGVADMVMWCFGIGLG